MKPLIEQRRENYRNTQRYKLKKDSFSIIANDCVGTFIYHDLGRRFLTPTINMFFESYNDYLEFLENINYYVNKVPQQIESTVDYPVGVISRDNKTITLRFMHYKTFDEAKDKWVERGKRINFNKLIVFWNCASKDGPSPDLFNRFIKLPFKNKYIITGKRFKGENVIALKVFDNKYFAGKLFKYKNRFAKKRYLDDVKYVDLINQII